MSGLGRTKIQWQYDVIWHQPPESICPLIHVFLFVLSASPIRITSRPDIWMLLGLQLDQLNGPLLVEPLVSRS